MSKQSQNNDDYFYKELIKASSDEDPKLIKNLIEKCGNIDYVPDSSEFTPLMNATNLFNYQAIIALIESGANIHKKFARETPLELVLNSDLRSHFEGYKQSLQILQNCQEISSKILNIVQEKFQLSDLESRLNEIFKEFKNSSYQPGKIIKINIGENNHLLINPFTIKLDEDGKNLIHYLIENLHEEELEKAGKIFEKYGLRTDIINVKGLSIDKFKAVNQKFLKIFKEELPEISEGPAKIVAGYLSFEDKRIFEPEIKQPKPEKSPKISMFSRLKSDKKEDDKCTIL